MNEFPRGNTCAEGKNWRQTTRKRITTLTTGIVLCPPNDTGSFVLRNKGMSSVPRKAGLGRGMASVQIALLGTRKPDSYLLIRSWRSAGAGVSWLCSGLSCAFFPYHYRTENNVAESGFRLTCSDGAARRKNASNIGSRTRAKPPLLYGTMFVIGGSSSDKFDDNRSLEAGKCGGSLHTSPLSVNNLCVH